MMCDGSNSSCKENGHAAMHVCSKIAIASITEYTHNHLRLFIAIVIRVVFSVVIISNETKRDGQATHIEQW